MRTTRNLMKKSIKWTFLKSYYFEIARNKQISFPQFCWLNSGAESFFFSCFLLFKVVIFFIFWRKEAKLGIWLLLKKERFWMYLGIQFPHKNGFHVFDDRSFYHHILGEESCAFFLYTAHLHLHHKIHYSFEYLNQSSYRPFTRQGLIEHWKVSACYQYNLRNYFLELELDCLIFLWDFESRYFTIGNISNSQAISRTLHQ